MKKIRLFLVAAVIVAAGSAFTNHHGGERYFRDGKEIFNTENCVLPVLDECYDVFDETGTIYQYTVYGTWIGNENK